MDVTWDRFWAVKKVTIHRRIKACHHAAVDLTRGVDLYRREGARGSFAGVMKCGNCHSCPICAHVISCRRCDQLVNDIIAATALGLEVGLLTLTVPHTRADDCRDLVDRESLSWRRLTMGSPWSRLLDRFGIQGFIRAFEITYGNGTGFHPHIHALFFYDKKNIDLKDLEGRIYPLWRKAAIREGLGAPSRAHGVDVRGGEYAARYVGKWGLAQEASLHPSKKSKGDRYHPFGLLDKIIETGSSFYKNKWNEYEEAVHAKKQLVYSRNLKKNIDAVEPEDQELVDSDHAGAEYFANVPGFLWGPLYRDNRLIDLQKYRDDNDHDSFFALLSEYRDRFMLEKGNL